MVIVNKKLPKKLGPGGKPILLATQDPVAKVLWQKTFREQVKPSHKMYNRKMQKMSTRQMVNEL